MFSGNPEIRFQQLMTALKERGFRLTPQRVELARLIAASEGHPSASQFLRSHQAEIPRHEPCNGL